jgi:hypothetical protein
MSKPNSKYMYVEAAPGWATKPQPSSSVQAAAVAAAMKASSAASLPRAPMTPYLTPVKLASLNTTKVSGTPVKWSTVAALPPIRKRKSRKTRKTRKGKSRK